MSQRYAARVSGILIACATIAAEGQTARATPPIRRLHVPSVAAIERFDAIDDVRGLSNGSVLVNDLRRRRLVLLDSSLGVAIVVADSLGGDVRRAYGRQGGGLVPLGRDSTLFIDRGSLAALLIDGSGTVSQVQAIPRTGDAAFLSSTAFGYPRRDASGGLVYRSLFPPGLPIPGPDGAIDVPSPPDTAPVLRLGADGPPDTIAIVRIATVKVSTSRNDAGRVVLTTQIDPLPLSDDWAVLSDGTIVIVRGRDYRIEWIRPDGTRSEFRTSFEWRRITDDEKTEIVDAAKKSLISGRAGRRVDAQYVVPAASELPDYAPPFVAPAARGDEDGNLWVRTTALSPLGPGYVYDVIHPDRGLIDRVQAAPGHIIVGFGPRGTVFLSRRDSSHATLGKSKR